MPNRHGAFGRTKRKGKTGRRSRGLLRIDKERYDRNLDLFDAALDASSEARYDDGPSAKPEQQPWEPTNDAELRTERDA